MRLAILCKGRRWLELANFATLQKCGTIVIMESERYQLRAEQRAAVARTRGYYGRCRKDETLDPRFLWNAKPRFGKTLTAYDFAAWIKAERVLIVTNRPAIADSWYADFERFGFREDGQKDRAWRWIFTASAAAKRALGEERKIYTRREQIARPSLAAKNYVHFISLQDIKGRKADGFKRKNKWIFETNWNLVIIDESHEGAETRKALRVFDNVKRDFTLYLSGTPFRALASKEFREEQIYNWSYLDEQKAKASWQGGQNPYAALPEMEIVVYRLARALDLTPDEAKSTGSGYAFDLGEFWKVKKIEGRDRFVYEAKVRGFLRNLRNPAKNYPFSQRGLRHTFWLLPGVKACRLLKELLLEDEYFGKNYAAEDIILAAGDGDNNRTAETALAEVQRRIGENPQQTRTITLSCGQLTTGITIPAWSGVLMLNNSRSPSQYIQAAFRAQNPAPGKARCIVYDFAPERGLEILARVVAPEAETTPKMRERKLTELIDSLPVWAEDARGQLYKLSANEIIEIPLQLVSAEVVNRGFMSNRLFQNIENIFDCPKDIREILSKLDEAKVGREVRRTGKTEIKLPQTGAENKTEQKIRSVENVVRDRLRGFARAIPSFLMAYGSEETTLANFEEKVPENVFLELTNITKAEFQKLRDGLGRQESEGGFFNAEVFNAAVREFNRKRTELAKYYQTSTDGDIFEYIPPQANHQIFTPREVVQKMLDLVEEARPGIFANTENTFIDLYMKSGLFVTGVAKRIFAQTRTQYRSDQDCIKHILERQFYGLAPTPVLAAITKNFIFGFDRNQQIWRDNFVEFDITDDARRGTVKEVVEDLFGKKGDEMKFTAVIGNPPYQETVGKSDLQTQSNSCWIYQYFQESADQLGELTCLIYPFGGWFDAPERLGGLGKRVLTDGHTVSVDAYEATDDRRAWYRDDSEPKPIFGKETSLSAGAAIVLRDLTNYYSGFNYSNRIYADERAHVATTEAVGMAPNPAFLKIGRKLTGNKLERRVQKWLFGVESNFVERNPEKVSERAEDWADPIQLLTNDRSGSAGRTKLYWTDKKFIPKGQEYFAKTKVILTAAYPKKSLVSGLTKIGDIQARVKELIEILPANSAFGASRMALYMSDNPRECENFCKYTRSKFFAALLLQEPNQRSSLGAIIPDQDFSGKSDIDWNGEIDTQLFRKYNLTEADLKFLGIE